MPAFRLSFGLLPALLLAVAACAAPAVGGGGSGAAEVVASLIVKPRVQRSADEVVAAMTRSLGSDAGVRYVRPMSGGAHVVQLISPASREQVPSLIERLRGSGVFEYVERDQLLKKQ